MSRYTPSQNKATQRYISKNYDQISIRVQKGDREKIQKAAESCGYSMNQFIVDAIAFYTKAVSEEQ